jgi:hypothetical protein
MESLIITTPTKLQNAKEHLHPRNVGSIWTLVVAVVVVTAVGVVAVVVVTVGVSMVNPVPYSSNKPACDGNIGIVNNNNNAMVSIVMIPVIVSCTHVGCNSTVWFVLPTAVFLGGASEIPMGGCDDAFCRWASKDEMDEVDVLYPTRRIGTVIRNASTAQLLLPCCCISSCSTIIIRMDPMRIINRRFTFFRNTILIVACVCMCVV